MRDVQRQMLRAHWEHHLMTSTAAAKHTCKGEPSAGINASGVLIVNTQECHSPQVRVNRRATLLYQLHVALASFVAPSQNQPCVCGIIIQMGLLAAFWITAGARQAALDPVPAHYRPQTAPWRRLVPFGLLSLSLM